MKTYRASMFVVNEVAECCYEEGCAKWKTLVDSAKLLR
jgi:hypothetical protein